MKTKNTSYALTVLLSAFIGVQSVQAQADSEQHPMCGDYTASYEECDGSTSDYTISITPANSSFPNSLFVNTVLPRVSDQSTAYSTPASIVSDTEANLELWYTIEGGVDLTSDSRVGQVCDLYLFAAYVAGQDTMLVTSVDRIPMKLSDDKNSVTIEAVQGANALVANPIIDMVPRGPFLKCVKLPLLITRKTSSLTGSAAEGLVRIYPTVTESDLYVEGYEGEIRLYDKGGVLLQRMHADNFQRVDLSAFKPGMYLLEIGDKTYKIVRK